jgi:hypothetical protein
LVITYDRSEFGRQRKTQIYRTYRTHKLISTNSHKHETLRRTIEEQSGLQAEGTETYSSFAARVGMPRHIEMIQAVLDQLAAA